MIQVSYFVIKATLTWIGLIFALIGPRFLDPSFSIYIWLTIAALLVRRATKTVADKPKRKKACS